MKANLLFYLFAATFTLNVHAQFEEESCSVNGALTALTNYGNKTKFIVDAYNKYNQIRSDFETLEGILSASCDAVEDHRSTFVKMLDVFKVVQLYIPLKVFIQPLQTVLDKVITKLLGKPINTFCDGTKKIRATLDLFDTKVNGTFFKFTNYALKVASTIQKAEEYMSYYESNITGVCNTNNNNNNNNTSIDLQFEEICEVSVELDMFIDPVYISFKEFFDIFEKLEKNLQLARDEFVDPLMDIFDKLNVVLDPIQDFLDIKFEIPYPSGSKSRGVGIIPSCCPSGYSNDAGLCYKNCHSESHESIGPTCMKKCDSGWTTVGPVCHKGWKLKTRNTYGRGVGKIPATFGNDACACRSDKKHLETGLCYNQCGRDKFSNYPTAILDRCWDFSSKSWTINNLVENLDILDKINDIPGLDDAIKAIDNLIDKIFSPLVSKIEDLVKIDYPTLPSIDFNLEIPDVLLKIKDLDLEFPNLGEIMLDYTNWTQFSC